MSVNKSVTRPVRCLCPNPSTLFSWSFGNWSSMRKTEGIIPLRLRKGIRAVEYSAKPLRTDLFGTCAMI